MKDFDPVMSDLIRHLNEEDARENFEDAVEGKWDEAAEDVGTGATYDEIRDRAVELVLADLARNAVEEAGRRREEREGVWL